MITIIALSSTVVSPYHKSWITNKAGFKYSPIFGFGRIDAEKALELAKDWENVPNIKNEFREKLDFDNDVLFNSGHNRGDGIVFYLEENDQPQYVHTLTIYIKAETGVTDGLYIRVTSPSGTSVPLLLPCNYDQKSFEEDDILERTFIATTKAFFGEPAIGDWIVFFHRDGLHLPEEVVTEIGATFYGFMDNSSFLKVNRREAVDNRIIFNETDEIIMDYEHDISQLYSQERKFKLHYSTKEDQMKVRIFLMENNENRRVYVLEEKTIKNDEENTIILPRILKTTEIYFCVESIEENSNQEHKWKKLIKIINTVDGQLTENFTRFDINDEEEYGKIHLEWGRQEKLPDYPQFAYSYLELFNGLKNQTVYSTMIKDIGQYDVILKTEMIPSKAVFIISPFQPKIHDRKKLILIPVIGNHSSFPFPADKYECYFIDPLVQEPKPIDKINILLTILIAIDIIIISIIVLYQCLKTRKTGPNSMNEYLIRTIL